ncbi:MAG: phage-shock protein [Desulfobacterales bacterium]|nr:phage-shock protein [Desulfobacterales bacterium]
MHHVMIVAIVFGSIVAVLAIIPATILIAIKLSRGGVSGKNRKELSEEARIMQEIYQGLSKMEKRVESLETILMDSQGKDRYS